MLGDFFAPLFSETGDERAFQRISKSKTTFYVGCGKTNKSHHSNTTANTTEHKY
jgi:hypothetical protein